MNANLKQLMIEAGYAAPELANRAQVLAGLLLHAYTSQLQELVDQRVPASEYSQRLLQHWHDN